MSPPSWFNDRRRRRSSKASCGFRINHFVKITQTVSYRGASVARGFRKTVAVL
jgi:hypothetical protein